MNIIERREKIIKDLRDKEYRDAFVTEHIDTGIPFQIRALREQRNWTQKYLGRCVGMAQETISRLEDPNYGKLTLNTLKRLASAFDIGLAVRFVPFSQLVDWELHLTPDSLTALSFEEEPYFKEKPKEEFTKLLMEPEQYSPDHGEVISLDAWREKTKKPINEAFNSEQKTIQTALCVQFKRTIANITEQPSYLSQTTAHELISGVRR